VRHDITWMQMIMTLALMKHVALHNLILAAQDLDGYQTQRYFGSKCEPTCRR